MMRSLYNLAWRIEEWLCLKVWRLFPHRMKGPGTWQWAWMIRVWGWDMCPPKGGGGVPWPRFDADDVTAAWHRAGVLDYGEPLP